MNLKELRIKFGMYQKDVAKYLGIDRTTYVKYETEVTEPDIKTLKKLADLFNVTLDYLLDRTMPEEAKPAASPDNALTSAELSLITAYRNRPEMQPAVNTLLGITTEAAEPSPSIPHSSFLTPHSSFLSPNSPDTAQLIEDGEIYPPEIIDALLSKKAESQK